MIRVELDLSAPSADYDALTIAGYVVTALSNYLGDATVVHRIAVEEVDAS